MKSFYTVTVVIPATAEINKSGEDYRQVFYINNDEEKPNSSVARIFEKFHDTFGQECRVMITQDGFNSLNDTINTVYNTISGGPN